MNKTIKSALLSVFHKDGLDQLVTSLHKNNVHLYATGGTFDFIKAMNIPVTPVENITGYPSILDGRVKTLHPAVFGGILAIRENEEHKAQMEKYQLPFIDLVVVDLYPFEKTVRTGASEEDIIEKIDIGGISLIRGAAKNFNDVVIIPSVNDYATLQQILELSLRLHPHLRDCCRIILFHLIVRIMHLNRQKKKLADVDFLRNVKPYFAFC